MMEDLDKVGKNKSSSLNWKFCTKSTITLFLERKFVIVGIWLGVFKILILLRENALTQPVFTCSKLTMETLE